nr:hypothetical protein [Tanacetum cinerariifolium]
MTSALIWQVSSRLSESGNATSLPALESSLSSESLATFRAEIAVERMKLRFMLAYEVSRAMITTTFLLKIILRILERKGLLQDRLFNLMLGEQNLSRIMELSPYMNIRREAYDFLEVVPHRTAAPILLKWFVNRDVPTGAPSSNGTLDELMRMGVSLAACKHPVLTTLRDTKAEKKTWGLGSGRNVTKGFHLGRDKMGGHGRSVVRANCALRHFFDGSRTPGLPARFEEFMVSRRARQNGRALLTKPSLVPADRGNMEQRNVERDNSLYYRGVIPHKWGGKRTSGIVAVNWENGKDKPTRPGRVHNRRTWINAKLNMMAATVTSSALALFWLPLPLFPGPSSFRPADLVVDNRSDLVKVVATPAVGHRTYRDARGAIYDVSIADISQAGYMDWPGSFSANETSISKPLEYLFDRRLYLYGEFPSDRSRPTLLQLSQELYGSHPRRDFSNDRTKKFYRTPCSYCC